MLVMAELSPWTWKTQDATDLEASSILDNIHLLEGRMYSTGIEKQSADLPIYEYSKLQIKTAWNDMSTGAIMVHTLWE